MKNKTSFTHSEIVEKLIGPINPIGETREDETRLFNLSNMTHLVYVLLAEIEVVATERDRCEYSIKVAGKKAHQFLVDLKNELKENYE